MRYMITYDDDDDAIAIAIEIKRNQKCIYFGSF